MTIKYLLDDNILKLQEDDKNIFITDKKFNVLSIIDKKNGKIENFDLKNHDNLKSKVKIRAILKGLI